MGETMRAWRTGPARSWLAESPVPTPEADELLVRVEYCGVCRTDLHVVDEEIPRHKADVVPGHQVVGTVVARGATAGRFGEGDVVGVAWLRHTCGACAWCRSGAENLCPNSEYTGWDADGGYAEYVTVPEAYAYDLGAFVRFGASLASVAPLLCAGIIGFRALKRAQLPPGGILGIYGFGSSGHLTALVAKAQGARVFAFTRGAANRALAAELGMDYVGSATDAPPEPLDAAISFAPAGDLVPVALGATRPGGTVVLAGIELSDIPRMAYEQTLFHERDLRTVTANTRADGEELLAVAAGIRLSPAVTTIDFENADEAIAALREGRASGSMVLHVG
jgi:propanol-preferring alcohol dehydrogenase